MASKQPGGAAFLYDEAKAEKERVEKAAAEAEEARLAEEERQRLKEEQRRLKAEARFNEMLDFMAESLSHEAIVEALEELNQEEADRRAAIITAKLEAKGKIPVRGDVRAIVRGEVAEVRAYDPKEGRYVAQLPNKELVTVKPSQLIRLRPPIEPPEEASVHSKYSSLKTW